jgi:hypothetical protein
VGARRRRQDAANFSPGEPGRGGAGHEGANKRKPAAAATKGRTHMLPGGGAAPNNVPPAAWMPQPHFEGGGDTELQSTTAGRVAVRRGA